MEATPAPASQSPSWKTIRTWLIIATLVPFLMLAAIIILMINLEFNFLNWME
jgi:hypothetical protein